jgi:hypothetical protein
MKSRGGEMGIFDKFKQILIRFGQSKASTRVISDVHVQHDMDLQKFVEIAHQLAKPSTELRLNGTGDPVAYWHGMSMEGAPVISFLDNAIWCEVSLDWEVEGRVLAVDEPDRHGLPLFESMHVSLPPVDAIFLLGGSEIDAYLQACGWSAADGFNGNFPDPIPLQYQELYWYKNCPLYSSTGAEAVKGGWCVPWPDDDWEEFNDKELVLWTFRESEPWIEVYRDGSGFRVKRRIT